MVVNGPKLVCLTSLMTLGVAAPNPAPTANASTGIFSWPAYPELQYATALPRLNSTATYARPYSDLSSLAGSQQTTTWANIATPTDTGEKFGNAAWSSLWATFSVDAPPITTTVSPTPVPSSELVKPTPLPFVVGKGETDDYQFPSDFQWGFTGSAVQVEGAVKSEGRGPTVLDRMIGRGPAGVPGAGPPDVSALNYYLYKQDIARLAAIGVKSYGLSISWSRILPFGVAGSPVNQEAIDHYDDLINTVLEFGMTPIVTLNHLDTPLYFMTSTSWQGYDHPEFVDGFVNYAKIVLTHYADRVGTWVTFNEPTNDAAIFKNWASSYNVLMAHAKTVHFYRDEIKGTGKWSFKLSVASGFPLPLDPGNPDDVASSQRSLDFSIGYLTNPIYLGTQIPSSVLETLGDKAPRYTDEELQYAGGTVDYLGVDIYAAIYATTLTDGTETCLSNSSHPAYPSCTNTTTIRAGWQIGAESNAAPFTFYQHARTMFKYLDTTYPTEEGIFLAEFGWPGFEEAAMSTEQARADMTSTLFSQPIYNEILKSIHEDEVKFKGALGWAYLDNWEFGSYAARYGVQTVNNVTLERSYKRSIFDIVDFVSSHTGN
ncbi:beta-glucosidase [Hypoxylon trugodes]|uniref:beta-glucosidase n=1 Tax=Hypoxylon trugodes TaxID=326681 RepID=UPI002192E509|nr:beta-glucosidase [Hypoxylon trugodes]KAI1393358.1 beta-glucosidase [Hypoxylon trugodes]